MGVCAFLVYGWSAIALAAPGDDSGFTTAQESEDISSSDRRFLATEAAPTIVEVSPPQAIQELRSLVEQYHPQVSIVSPEPETVLEDDVVSLQFAVNDLTVFQDPQLQLGPHLQVLLDYQPFATVYDLTAPLKIKGLQPGTHTVDVLVCDPWNESFKNEGAAAQVTFHVFTKTQASGSSDRLGGTQLIYNSPTGTVGAEPLLLDFVVKRDSKLDNSARLESTPNIQVTINGQSFITKQEQGLFLKGFKRGKNWIQLDMLDAEGAPVPISYGPIVQLVTLQPAGDDALSQLMRGDLSTDLARGIVEPSSAFSEDNATAPEETIP